MAKLSQEQIHDRLDSHELWLDDPEMGSSADFSRMNLDGYDFTGADLRGAKFKGTSLMAADFTGADLTNAIFDHADLRDANLTNCILSEIEGTDDETILTNISNADTIRANLNGVSIEYLEE